MVKVTSVSSGGVPKLCGTNYPVSISFIVVNEFCERFSYYGMKAVLTLYFINYLHWDQNLSTAVYHAFSSLCYFTPVLGALIADSWLGKFRTIIYLSVVYVLGHIIKSVGAIPSVGNSTVHMSVVGSLSMLGLVLIAFGTGGIKPCVAAFGGDQFDEEHTIERRKFFSIFYMSINAGSVLSTVITPILRGYIIPIKLYCQHTFSIIVFISGSGMYKKSPPEGNVLSDVCKCIGLAIKNRWRSSEFDSKKKHWLDWAEEKYPRRLIHEIKMVLRVLVLYIPLPMFWALFDQQGSRWTLQATRMNMAFVSLTVNHCHKFFLSLLPLKKMAVGMILAALAFGAATLVEVNVMKTVVEPAPRGQCLLQVYNLAESDIQLDISGSNLFSQPIKSYEDPPSYQHLQLGGSSKNVSMRIIQNKNTSECVQSFREQKAYSLILHSSGSGVVCQLASDNIIKSKKMEAHLRFINTLSEAMNITVGDVDFYVAGDYGISPNKSVIRNKYTKVRCSSGSQVSFINLGLLDFGASYTIILTNGSVGIVPKKMVDVVANNIHITWQIPQYILITAGEVMFSITGLEFSYSQAPANMKSVLQAGWLLTVAFGNVIVLIVAEGAGLNQWMEFLLFAGLLVAVCIIFSIMAYFYKYVDPEELDKLFQDKTVDGEDDDSLKKDKKEHMEQAGDSTYLKSGIKNTAM
uniref:Solute carrier family 15 member 2 n=1 Tax=Esox lucius TaxID=8010 RepID=A0A6Q2ZM08_ESOLU